MGIFVRHTVKFVINIFKKFLPLGIEIPKYAQEIFTEENLVEDSFEGKIGQFSEGQQKELKGLRRKLKNRVNCTFESAVV